MDTFAKDANATEEVMDWWIILLIFSWFASGLIATTFAFNRIWDGLKEISLADLFGFITLIILGWVSLFIIILVCGGDIIIFRKGE